MKFLLDANIPHSAKKIFPRSDTVLHVRDIGLADASDEAIIAYASKESAVVITRDLDFANIILHPVDTIQGSLFSACRLILPPQILSRR